MSLTSRKSECLDGLGSACEIARMLFTPALIAIVSAPPPGAAASDDKDRVYNALDGLRRSSIRIGGVVLLFSIAGYYLAEPVLRHLAHRTGVELAAFGIPETFFTFLVLALAIGVFASFPYILYSVLSGIRQLFPAFSAAMMRGFWLASIVLFYAGVLFCEQLSLPYGVEFLLDVDSPHIEALISVEKFVSFCMVFIFGFGILFELPLAMILFGRIGAIKRAWLARSRRYAVLVITVIAAVITPTPDVFNLSLMAVPLYLLYEVGLLGMRLYGPTVPKPDAAEPEAQPSKEKGPGEAA
jgi:sec-independent protein translocase protein TatC